MSHAKSGSYWANSSWDSVLCHFFMNYCIQTFLNQIWPPNDATVDKQDRTFGELFIRNFFTLWNATLISPSIVTFKTDICCKSLKNKFVNASFLISNCQLHHCGGLLFIFADHLKFRDRVPFPSCESWKKPAVASRINAVMPYQYRTEWQTWQRRRSMVPSLTMALRLKRVIFCQTRSALVFSCPREHFILLC